MPRNFAHGLPTEFVQDNHSRSACGTIRGLHYQIQRPQGKLVRVVQGAIFDVAVDLRRDSDTFRQWYGVVFASDANRLQLYVPAGCAHGFCALSEGTEIIYKCTDLYCPEHERTLLWNDPALGIEWPEIAPILSEKDARGVPLAQADCYAAAPCAVR